MRTASRDEIAIEVHDRAVAVAERLGVPLENPTLGPVQCTGPVGEPSSSGVFYMSGTHQLLVGNERLREALLTIREHFTQQGFQLEDIRWLEDGSGQLRATDREGYRFSLLPTDRRGGFAFSVDSPCFQAPVGEDPTDPLWAPPPEVTWTSSPAGGPQ